MARTRPPTQTSRAWPGAHGRTEPCRRAQGRSAPLPCPSWSALPTLPGPPVSCWVLLRLGAVRYFSGKHRQSPPVGGADGGVCWLCLLRPIGERDLVRVMGLFGSPSEAFPGAATGENLPAVARPLGKHRLRQQPRLAQPRHTCGRSAWSRLFAQEATLGGRAMLLRTAPHGVGLGGRALARRGCGLRFPGPTSRAGREV